jgi:hypothetical protein
MEKRLICLESKSEGIKLLGISVQIIKRFIEKHGMDISTQ